QLVQELVPSTRDGGMVKFVASGTEATLMAMRVARAFTGKDVIVKFRGHFHGWHDYATVGMSEPWDIPSSNGVPLSVQQTMRANPIAAAAGVACLNVVKDPSIQKKATDTANKLRAGLNESFKRRGVAGSAGGEVSILSIKIDNAKVSPRELIWKFRGALQVGGA